MIQTLLSILLAAAICFWLFVFTLSHVVIAAIVGAGVAGYAIWRRRAGV